MELNPRFRKRQMNDRHQERIDKILEGSTEEECEAVIRAYAEEADRDPTALQYFNGTTNWRPDNFDRTLGKIGAPTSGPTDFSRTESNGARTARLLREKMARDGRKPMMPPGVTSES